MKKVCPRCGQAFECRRDEIALCHCASVGLDAEQRAYVRARYPDCLCHACLLEIKSVVRASDANRSSSEEKRYD